MHNRINKTPLAHNSIEHIAPLRKSHILSLEHHYYLELSFYNIKGNTASSQSFLLQDKKLKMKKIQLKLRTLARTILIKALENR